MAEDRITRDDLESELRSVVGDPEGPIVGNRPMLVLVAAASAAAIVALVYVMGRRAGRRRSTLVEVRRF
jgi:hypothetical protein|tara:strand:- start:3131 stop:3337 length:207 start_codon:yes stop_codon:yes gene_type:complete